MKDFLQQLASSLQAVAQARGYVVALSGGMDSMVLLHALATLAKQTGTPGLRALHIHHGLQDEADTWQACCEKHCQTLGIPLACIAVTVAEKGSLEAAARAARYAAFADSLQEGEVLLTAQHRDDQMETLLLRLMRGAGPTALAGMPVTRPLGKGRLYRPLLNKERSAIESYARQHKLEWIEDPSNNDTDLDRNFCRHELLPRIEQRWPGYRDSWHKSQTLLAESGELLQQLASADLTDSAVENGARLQVERLLQLSPGRQRNLLRHWLRILELPDPGWNPLHQLCNEVLRAPADSDAALTMADVTIQVQGGLLQALRLPTGPPQAHAALWNAANTPHLPLADNGQLTATKTKGRGLGRQHAEALEVRFRTGGEAIHLPARPSRALKKLLQESNMPPWLRARLPLLYHADRLVYVPGFGPQKDYAATPEEQGLLIDWQAPDFVLRPPELPTNTAKQNT